MNFCKKCENMYYLKIDIDDNEKTKLIHYCRNCGDENNSFNENICVYEADLNNINTNFNLINEYTKYDPTFKNKFIKCPNQKCQSNNIENQVEREILYIRNNNNNMNYVYLCAICDTNWKNK